MSLTGSLMTYDNNNDLLNTSQEKMLKKSTTIIQGVGQKQPLVAVSTQTGGGNSSRSKNKSSGCCSRRHLNSLWSLWYGLLATLFQIYIVMLGMRRFLGYWLLEWRNQSTGAPIDPPMEVTAGLISLGVAGFLLAPFLASAVFRAGNLPNDGRKLGSQLSTCSAGPPAPPLRDANPKNHGVLRSLWQHGGPTAPFLHLVIAFCLLLPKVTMEARLIQSGFLPQETVWRTDLDFLIISKDRLVISSFMTSTNSNNTTSTIPTPLPMVTLMPSSNKSTKSSVKPTVKTVETVTLLPKRNTSKSQIKGDIPNKPSLSSAAKIQSNETELEQNSSAFSMEKTLIGIFGVEPWNPTDSRGWSGPVSLEYLNYAFALLVYAVRYPAVFWSTNKCFGLIFSFQLLVNGIQSLISFAGMSVLYKVQMMGAEKALPLLRHKTELNLLGGESPFLLNPLVTLALYILSEILVLSSSLVLYLYGYGKFNAFLNNEREKKVIMIREGRTASGWGYFTHCAALCVLLAIAVCCAPLLHDFTVVYRGSLDGAALACVISTIFHLFLWVLVWLFLTLKQKWIFKVRVTIGRATVRSARSIKLVTDVDLSSQKDDDLTTQPLLIVGNGRTYTISETSPKKTIMNVIQRAAIERKAKLSGNNGNDDDGEEQIYWLRPKTMTLNPSDSNDKLTWFNKKLTSNSSASGKPTQKVTFNDVPCTSNNRNKERGTSLRIGEGDDGDYATLKELPLGSAVLLDPGDDTSEEGKLLACVRDDSVTYACTNRDLVPPCDYEDPSPLMTPEALPDPPTEPSSQLSSVTTSSAVTVHTSECQSSSGLTPRCLRRADSGVPGEETVRSGSGSSGSSPPDPPGSSTSDSSSGVHSATSMPAQRPRANSFDDFVLEHQTKEETKLKSFSLQRGVLPPTAVSAFTSAETNQSVYGFAGVQYTTVLNPNMNGHIVDNSVPTTIIENGLDGTLIIRRKNAQPIVKSIIPQPVINEEPFGRSTNMKMTTFANSKESLRNIVASAATLPHYPTQPVDTGTPHCSTMPLNIEARGVMLPPPIVSGSSCQSFSRPHCTLPNHQGGLRLVGALPAIRRPPARPRAAPSHHSFPVHLLQTPNYGNQINRTLHNTERDSANYSMASSGDSDNNMYISVNRA